MARSSVHAVAVMMEMPAERSSALSHVSSWPSLGFNLIFTTASSPVDQSTFFESNDLLFSTIVISEPYAHQKPRSRPGLDAVTLMIGIVDFTSDIRDA